MAMCINQQILRCKAIFFAEISFFLFMTHSYSYLSEREGHAGQITEAHRSSIKPNTPKPIMLATNSAQPHAGMSRSRFRAVA